MFTETQRCRWNYGIVCNVYFRHQTSCYEGQYLITMIGRMVELATMRQLLRDSFIWRKSMLRPSLRGGPFFQGKASRKDNVQGQKYEHILKPNRSCGFLLSFDFFSRRAVRNYYEQFTVTS